MRQKELSKLLGIKASALSDLLSGKRSLGKSKARTVADVSGLPVTLFLYGYANEIRAALEGVYGKIEDGRGKSHDHEGNKK